MPINIDYVRDLDSLAPSVVVPSRVVKEILGFKSEEGLYENMKFLGLRRVRISERLHGVTAGNLRDAIRRQSGLTA
jgi:hypothetical protein